MARFSRLYPVYLLTLLISVPMLMVEWHARSRTDFWMGAVATPLLAQGFFPHLATFWNVVSWTLSCEVVLYLAFPFLLKLRWAGAAVAAGADVDGFLGAGAGAAYDLLADQPRSPARGGRPVQRRHLAEHVEVHAGCVPVHIFGRLTLGRLHDALHLTPRGRMAAGVAGFLLAWLAVYHVAPAVPYILVHGGLLTPVWSLVIVGLAGVSPLARVFSVRPLVAVGTSTYALYLLHFNVFTLLQWNHVTERLHVQRGIHGSAMSL